MYKKTLTPKHSGSVNHQIYVQTNCPAKNRDLCSVKFSSISAEHRRSRRGFERGGGLLKAQTERCI